MGFRPLAFFTLAFAISLFGCRREQDSARTEDSTNEAQAVVDEGCPHQVDGKCIHPSATPQPKPQKGTQLYGSALGASPEVKLTEVLKEPDRFHQKDVKVSGYVSRACSRKGCWMELATGDSPDASRCRVTFKDYGFFVPKNAAGSTATLEGTVQVTEVKREAVKHYESEGATFENKTANGSAREVRLVATGVELTRI